MYCNSRKSKTGWLAVLVTVLFSAMGWGAASNPPAGSTFVYVVTGLTEDSYIAQFQVASNGTVRSLSPATVPSGNNTVSIATSPDGKYLFALDNPGDLSPGTFLRFSINSDGTLASNPVSSIGPTGFIYPFTLTPDGQFAFVPVGNTVMSYRVDASGEFTLVSTIGAGINACTAAVDPTGQFAYVGNCGDHTISEYTVASDGEFTSNGLISISPIEGYLVSFSPQGFLYSAGCCQLKGLVQYAISPSLGAITSAKPFSIGHLPWSFAFTQSGKYAYTLNADSGAISISLLRVNTLTGALTKNGPDIPISGRGAGQIIVDPYDRFVFLTQPAMQAGAKGAIWMFRIDSFGRLALVGNLPLAIGDEETSGSIATAVR